MIKEKIIEDHKAQQRLHELDKRYKRFVSGLAISLRDLAYLKYVYVSADKNEPFTSMIEINPLIACTAWLFAEMFFDLDDERFNNIAESGAFLALASGVMDKLVDGQAEQPEIFIIFHQALFEHAYSGFRNTFPVQSPFWTHFDRLTREYWASLAIETECQSDYKKLSFPTFTQMTGGKVTPMVVTIAALSEATGQPELIEPIEASFKCTYVAGQMHDDILDWPYDVEVKHLTYFLKMLASDDLLTSETWPSVDELRERNRRDWVDIDGYTLALEWYDRAIRAVGDIECPSWIMYLQEYKGYATRDQKRAMTYHVGDIIHSLKV